MSRINFSFVRGESAVAATVTTVVCAWFLMAAGAILTDPVSPYTTRTVHTAAALTGPVAIAPEARLTITVEAHRG